MKKVFVTVGTTQFDGLLHALSQPRTLESLLRFGYTDITVQYGKGELPKFEAPEGLVIETFRFSPSIGEQIAEADLVISHAGSGTILETLGAGKRMITVINDSLMNNHQTELAGQMSKDGHLIYCNTSTLTDAISRIQTAKLTPYKKGDPKLFGAFLDKVLGFHNDHVESPIMLNRAIHVVYFIGFLDMVAVGMFIPLFPQHARKVGISSLNIGLFGSVYGFLQFLSSATVGSWSDRSGKVSVLVKCILLSSVGYYILGATDTLFFLFISRIIAGCFKHTQTLTKAFLTDVISTEERHKVYGMQLSFSNVGFIVGPLLGGLISELENGFHIAATIGAALFLFQALVVRYFLYDIVKHHREQEKQEESVKKKTSASNWNDIMSRPHLRANFIIQLLLSASSLLFRENASLLLHLKFQTSPRNIGFMISFANFVSSVSGFFVGRLAKFYGDDDTRLLLHCTIAHVFAILTSTFAPEFWVYNVCLVPYKLAQSISRIAVLNMMVQNADGVPSGELMGCSQSLLSFNRIVAPFLCGLLQEATVLLPGCLAGVLGILVIPFVRSMRRKTD